MLPGTTAPLQPQGDGNPQHPPGWALVGQGCGIGMFVFPTVLGRSGSAGENGHRARSGALLSSCSRMDEQMDAAELPGLCPT